MILNRYDFYFCTFRFLPFVCFCYGDNRETSVKLWMCVRLPAHSSWLLCSKSLCKMLIHWTQMLTVLSMFPLQMQEHHLRSLLVQELRATWAAQPASARWIAIMRASRYTCSQLSVMKHGLSVVSQVCCAQTTLTQVWLLFITKLWAWHKARTLVFLLIFASFFFFLHGYCDILLSDRWAKQMENWKELKTCQNFPCFP